MAQIQIGWYQRLSVEADAGTSYVSVSMDSRLVCGLTTSDALKCWGYSPGQFLHTRPIAPPNLLPSVANNNAIYLSDFVLGTAGGRVTFAVNFAGDVNTDATLAVKYCNLTDSPNCDPSAGTNFVFISRGVGDYSGWTAVLASPNDPGDVLKVHIRATDADGVYGEYSTTITLP
jgi:hypothetical protein